VAASRAPRPERRWTGRATFGLAACRAAARTRSSCLNTADIFCPRIRSRKAPVPWIAVDSRKALRGLGKTLMSAGTLLLLFVAFQLWGTGISESHAQTSLKKQFLASAPSTTVAPTPTTVASTTATTSTTDPADALPPPPSGSAVAIIKIPRIGVDAAVVEGVGVPDLMKGPGHYPGSPMPGQPGNAAIAGHRTTYGAPFYRLNELQPGDQIFVSTKDSPHPFEYIVESSKSVDPSDVSVLLPTADNQLTLTTCTPRFESTQRLVVVSRLVGAVDPTPVVTIPNSSGLDQDALGTESIGLSGQGESRLPAILWALVCAAIWFAAWAVGLRWRRWTSYAVAMPVFLVCLFFFFESFARFLPANV
jgi:sortase A